MADDITVVPTLSSDELVDMIFFAASVISECPEAVQLVDAAEKVVR